MHKCSKSTKSPTIIDASSVTKLHAVYEFKKLYPKTSPRAKRHVIGKKSVYVVKGRFKGKVYGCIFSGKDGQVE